MKEDKPTIPHAGTLLDDHFRFILIHWSFPWGYLVGPMLKIHCCAQYICFHVYNAFCILG